MRRRGMSLCALVLAGGCLTAPPDPGEEEGLIPRPVSICSGDPGPAPVRAERWSIASLPGWTQQDAVASDLEDWFLDLGVFNHVLHGSIATTDDGLVTFENADLYGVSQSCAGVVAAHRLGYPILVVLGGDGDGFALAQATDDADRPALVAGLVDFIDTYGYDGVSIAWLEDVAPGQLTALIQELSAAFADRTPRPLLTVDVTSDIVAPEVTAGWAPYVDAINIMSYDAGWEEELARHLAAGVPRELVNLGIGLSFGDLAVEDVQAKIELAVDAGLLGVESWELGDLGDSSDPRLAAYAPLFSE